MGVMCAVLGKELELYVMLFLIIVSVMCVLSTISIVSDHDSFVG